MLHINRKDVPLQRKQKKEAYIMSKLIKPDGYKALLDMKQTEQGIKLIKEFFQQKEQTKKRTVSEAVILGKFHLMQRVNKELSKGAKIEKTDLSFVEKGDSVIVTLECECLENIAVKTPIDKSEELEYNEVKPN